MIKVSKHYDTLTAPERLILAMDAMGRGDHYEANLLGETCPKVQYKPQRDLAYTRKYDDLQTLTLLHAALFYEVRGAMLAAMMLNHFMPDGKMRLAYKRRRAELMAHIAAWKRFCEYAGFDPDTTLKAFGLTLDPMLEDIPAVNAQPDETMIDEIFQSHLRIWQS
jgi:hypothetical protein